VLSEHPQRSAFLKRAFRIVRSTGAPLHVNAHFSSLPGPQSFIHSCERILRRDRPAFISIMVADRALFAALDIVRRALGSLEFRGGVVEPCGSFCVVCGFLATVPAILLIQSERASNDAALHDAAPSYLADIRTDVVFSSGILSLSSVAGPVLWNANYFRHGRGTDELWKLLPPDKPVDAASLRRLRIAANEQAIAALAHSVRSGRRPPEQSPEHLLDVSRAWEKIGRLYC